MASYELKDGKRVLARPSTGNAGGFRRPAEPEASEEKPGPRRGRTATAAKPDPAAEE